MPLPFEHLRRAYFYCKTLLSLVFTKLDYDFLAGNSSKLHVVLLYEFSYYMRFRSVAIFSLCVLHMAQYIIQHEKSLLSDTEN